MTWLVDENGEYYDDGSSASIYGGTGDNLVPTGNRIYGDTVFDLTPTGDPISSYGATTFDLTPYSSANVTEGMTPVQKAALKSFMEDQSNANTTGGGPGPATNYLASLVAAVKSGALSSEAIKNLSAPVQAAVTKALNAPLPASPSFLDKIGDFLGTTTGKAIGIGGLAALLQTMGNKGTGEIYKGYQGGIPNYSATRTMNAIPTTTVDASGKTVARRPGQGGITYFSPMRYTEAGAATSGTPPSPAAGIAALPEANTASAAPAAGITASSPAYSRPTLEFSTPNVPNMPPMAGPAPSAPPAGVPATGIAAASPAYSRPTLEFSTPNVPNMPPMAGPAPVPFDPMGQASLGVVVYGPDGKAYGSPAAARAAGVENATMSPPAGAPASAPGAYSAPTLNFSTPNIVQREPMAKAAGGLSSLGGYSDGGRLLRGPGDGISDSIPATIGQKQPARLADGEFVVPARVVSEIGNGSTEAGARKLYAMMDRVQKARGKTLKNVAANSKADKYLPA
jgi:hypothetical protein